MFSLRNYPKVSSYIKNLITKHNFSTNSAKNNEKICLKDKYNWFRFEQIYVLSNKLKNSLIKNSKIDLAGQKVGILCSNNYTYLISVLGVWLARGVPVPLSKNFSNNYIRYFLNDADCKILINSLDPVEHYEYYEKQIKSPLDSLLESLNVQNFKLSEHEFYRKHENNQIEFEDEIVKNHFFDKIGFNRNSTDDCLVIYTSGSTGSPKGVVLSYANLYDYMKTSIECWKLNKNDCLLNVLPLNHVHGLIYSLLTPFFVGAQVELLSKFDPNIIWSKLIEQNSINIFTAVPTVYARLIEHYRKTDTLFFRSCIRELAYGLKNKMRIMASASAPLNDKIYREWYDLTNYKIIERYGLTELGLGLSNPLDLNHNSEYENVLRPCGIGRPYGNVRVRICEILPDYERVLVESNAKEDVLFELFRSKIVGELQFKGPMVFKGYLNRPNETKLAFTKDGWFKTGDTAEFLLDKKCYKILGRTSDDLIKSGGYKISALDIEREILAHPNVKNAAVFGVNDLALGQKIACLLELKQNSPNEILIDEARFLNWCKTSLPKHWIPRIVQIVEKIPCNEMGKVNKKQLEHEYELKNY